MNFRTEITPRRPDFSISHEDRLLFVGSCFSDAVSVRLRRQGFRLAANPFGVLYNPASVCESLETLAAERVFVADDLERRGDIWFSHAFHGSFADSDPERALERMNGAVRRGALALREATCVALTFGSARVYERDGRAVANCHKMPASLFTRRMLSVGEIVALCEPLFDGALRGKKIIMTVSPVRYLQEGAEDASLDKATLRVAVAEVVRRHPEVACYFPSLELVQDDLRDYRFYREDMIHPTEQAADYVCEKFAGTFFTPQTLELADRIAAIYRAAEHRPLHPESEAFRRFCQNLHKEAVDLQRSCPSADLEGPIAFFARNS